MSGADQEHDLILQELGADLVGLLSGLVRGLGLYDAHNTVVTRMLDGLLTLTERTGAECLELRLLDDEFFVNGRLLRVDAPLYARAADLAASLGRLGVGRIELGPELTREDLTGLAERLVAGLRGGAFTLDDIGDVRLGRPLGTSVAALRFQPDRLALYTLSGLVDLVDRLRDEHAAGRRPSLRPLRRLLRLVVEGMDQDPAPYVAVAGVRVPGVALSRGRRDVLRAVLAVGFGGALGLDRRGRMTLGLGCVLGALVEDVDADDAVEALARYAGLGTDAVSLLLAVHDAAQIRAGHVGGLQGQVLALVRGWVERTATGARPEVPGAVAAGLADGTESLVDVDLDRSFAAWLGRWPVGSVLTLEDGRLAVVVSREPDGRWPVVRPLDSDGVPGPKRDLAALGLPPGAPVGVDAGAVDLTAT